jgi:hypothetical protein
MTTNRITLAELANREERDRRTKEAIQERDGTVKGVFTEFNLQVVGKRQPIADRGWDTSYCVQREGGEPRRFAITVDGTLKGESLRRRVRSQIEAALAGDAVAR